MIQSATCVWTDMTATFCVSHWPLAPIKLLCLLVSGSKSLLHGHAAWPLGPVHAPHVPHPIPCFSGGSPSPLWGSAPMASPGGPILVASSSPRPQGCEHRGHPQHPTMERCVVGCCSAPRLGIPVFPTQNPPVLSWVLIPPGPSTSPYPVCLLYTSDAADDVSWV